MAMIHKSRSTTDRARGFALLISVIFTGVILTVGLAISSLGYKQSSLSSTAVRSQYAFYAADAAMECALYSDQRQDGFNYTLHSVTKHPNPIICGAIPATELKYLYTSDLLYVSERLPLEDGARCADVTIYKYKIPYNGFGTYIFSQGYDSPCDVIASVSENARFVSRGLYLRY